MSLMSALGVGERGLSASQLALDVVGQNVTNANTAGYSRKRVELAPIARTDPSLGQVGFGVDIVSIKRLRDALLDRQISEARTSLGEKQQLDATLERVEDILAEPDDTGINEFMEKFWNSWQDLANNPSNLAARTAVVDSGRALAEKMRMVADGMLEYRASRDDEIEGKVRRINVLLSEIKNHNDVVAAAEGGMSGTATESRDRREAAVRELSELLDVQYIEDSLGRYNVTSSGQLLVTPEKFVPIGMERTQMTLSDGSPFSQVGLTVQGMNAAFEPKGGEIKGLLTGRDEILPRIMGRLDDMARVVVREVNAAHRLGFDYDGFAGGDFFDPETTGARDIALSTDILSGARRVAAGSGGTTVGLGAPLAQVVPAVGSPLDLPSAANPAYRNLVPGSVSVRAVGPPAITLAEGAGKDYTVDYELGRIYFRNTGALPPGTPVELDFRYQAGGSQGRGDGTNALRIAQLRNKATMEPDTFGKNGFSFGDFYADFVGQIGAEREVLRTNVETTTNLVEQYEKRAEEVAGVSLDEEMSDMVRFQHSYQASARYMSTISELLDTLIHL